LGILRVEEVRNDRELFTAQIILVSVFGFAKAFVAKFLGGGNK
jgi:hypothetical protein